MSKIDLTVSVKKLQYFTFILFIYLNSVLPYSAIANIEENIIFQRFSTLGQNKAQLKAKQFQTRLSFSAKYSLPLGIESANILS